MTLLIHYFPFSIFFITLWSNYVLGSAEKANCSQPIDYSKLSWSYEDDCSGPNNWHLISPLYCRLNRQSPIDLTYSESRYDPSLTSPIISRVNKSSDLGKYKVKNNGHGVQIDIPDKEWQVTYSGSNDIYYVIQFHWHWGNASTNIGSEHAINSRFHDMEAHLVTYNSIYPDRNISSESLLAIFGIMFEVVDSATDNIMDTVTATFTNDKISQKTNEGDFLEIDGFDLKELFPSTTSRFFRYYGSLTTPPCYQNAIWTVFETPRKVSKDNLKKFRTLLKHPDGRSLSDNIRPLQQLNVLGGGNAQRIISTSFKVPSSLNIGRDTGILTEVLFFSILSAFTAIQYS